jgi:hypothetical protein
MRPGVQPAIDHKAAAAACAKDDCENRLGAGPGTVCCFGQRKAVGVIGQPDRFAECRLKVLLKRSGVDPCRVGVVHLAGLSGYGTGNADADGAGCSPDNSATISRMHLMVAS